MKKDIATKLIAEKIDELKSTIASTKTNDAISKNTRGTKLYALSRERRVLHLINELVNQIDVIKLSDEASKTFTLLTTLASERIVQSSIEVHEGDKLLDLMKKYENKKDLLNKINRACEAQGLAVDFASGTIIPRIM